MRDTCKERGYAAASVAASWWCASVCVRACVHTCVHACARACVCGVVARCKSTPEQLPDMIFWRDLLGRHEILSGRSLSQSGGKSIKMAWISLLRCLKPKLILS